MIKAGTEKQTAWAENIAAEWRKEIEAELKTQDDRISMSNDSSCAGYRDELVKTLSLFDAAIEKASDKGIIEMYVAKKSPVKMMIAQALARYNGSKNEKNI